MGGNDYQMITSIAFGLLSAVFFGVSDILVALLTKRLGVLLTLLGVQVVGATAILAVYALEAKSALPSSLWTPQQLLIGASLGVVTTGAYLCFYAALAKGPLAVVSPISSAYGVITVLLAMLVLHEAFPVPVGVGLALALSGVIFASAPGKEPVVEGDGTHLDRMPRRHRFVFPAGSTLALFALLGFGLELFLLSLWSRTRGPVIPVLFLQIFMALALGVISLLQPRRTISTIKQGISRRGTLLLVVCGCLNMGGLLCYDFGITRGEFTSVVAALTSSYSVLPLLYGVFVFHECLSRFQLFGVVVLLAGIIVLSSFQLI
jgi:drug/metabolite transporter (DMT)-like permease